jgi:type I restriction enzyme M protein
MAKSTKKVKEKAIEVTLWETAIKLRGSVEPAEYKHVVLGLIFLKFTNDMIFIPSLITGGGVPKFF